MSGRRRSERQNQQKMCMTVAIGQSVNIIHTNLVHRICSINISPRCRCTCAQQTGDLANFFSRGVVVRVDMSGSIFAFTSSIEHWLGPRGGESTRAQGGASMHTQCICTFRSRCSTIKALPRRLHMNSDTVSHRLRWHLGGTLEFQRGGGCVGSGISLLT